MAETDVRTSPLDRRDKSKWIRSAVPMGPLEVGDEAGGLLWSIRSEHMVALYEVRSKMEIWNGTFCKIINITPMAKSLIAVVFSLSFI
jgi:hypothetical protein